MKNRLETVQQKIIAAAQANHRDPKDIHMVAVSKTVDPTRIKEAISLGVSTFGENYIQEAKDKINELTSFKVSWHFIGHLQSNKAKYAVKLFDLIHSVDSVKLAQELNRQAEKHNKIQSILIQINISQEQSKSGIAAEQTKTLISEISQLKHISIKGLMTMPPFFDDPEMARPFFRSLKNLQDEINQANINGIYLKELSMGMTDDFEVAIAEGATMLRIGTALFGHRN